MKSIIILCGGRSKRMGKDKGSLLLDGKPMLLHVLDTVGRIAEEIILVLRDKKQVGDYSQILKEKNIKIVTDKSKDQGPLMGILTGLSNIKSEQAQILPCDSPFISSNFVLNMFEAIESSNYDALIPLWADGHTEPLHSIYKKKNIKKIEELIKDGKRNVNSLIESINVRYIKVEELDPSLRSFQNINTVNDINK
ncbi:MAG: molybdenum cofactor guanylyltransferase [Methanobacterium sp.]